MGGIVGYPHTMKSGHHIARLLTAAALVVTTGFVAGPGASPVQAAACTWAAAASSIRCRRRESSTPVRPQPSTMSLLWGPSRWGRRIRQRSTSPCSGTGGIPAGLRQRARRGRQHHGHRAGRQRLPRGLRQGGAARGSHLDRQLRAEPDGSQRGHRPTGRRRCPDDRAVRPERHRPGDRRRLRMVLVEQLHTRHRGDRRRVAVDPVVALAHPRHPRRHRPACHRAH